MSYDPIDDAQAQRYELSLDQANRRIATLESEAAAMIRRLAAALKDYDEGLDRRDILAMRHADALRDVKEQA